MLTAITCLATALELLLPTLALCFVYPFNKKASLFWSDYIACRSARILFAIFKLYRKFNFLGDKESKASLPDQFIVLSNHQSLLDIVVYLKYFGGKRTRFVAKDTLASVPMVGKMLKTQEHCMIPRRGSASVAMASIDRFSERVLQRNQIPVIFPEGTRSRDGNLRKFSSAGFRRLVEKTHLPIAVCALDGGWNISNLDTVIRTLHKGAYRVKVLKVYPFPETKQEEKLILEESQVLIQKQLEEWRKLPKESLIV